MNIGCSGGRGGTEWSRLELKSGTTCRHSGTLTNDANQRHVDTFLAVSSLNFHELLILMKRLILLLVTGTLVNESLLEFVERKHQAKYLVQSLKMASLPANEQTFQAVFSTESFCNRDRGE